MALIGSEKEAKYNSTYYYTNDTTKTDAWQRNIAVEINNGKSTANINDITKVLQEKTKSVNDYSFQTKSFSKANRVWLRTSITNNADKAREELQGLSTGTYIWLTTTSGYEHAVSVIDTSSTGITVYQANLDCKCGVLYITYSWKEFTEQFRYLSYYVD